jgi:hypothetical protein
VPLSAPWAESCGHHSFLPPLVKNTPSPESEENSRSMAPRRYSFAFLGAYEYIQGARVDRRS